MFTIRKRSLPTPPKVVGILRNYESGKKPRRSVGFLDEIGRPLVEYRNIPYDDDIDKTTSLPYHEKTSGRVDNRAKWNLVRVKTAKPLRTGPSETGLIEEMRLEENQISRAPLFGTFDVIDAPHLHIDALVRARARVPVIPLDENYIEFEPKSDNTYQQVFDVPSKPTNLVALMAQLKERGLLPTEQQSSHLPSVGIAIPQMPEEEYSRRDNNYQPNTWKAQQACSFFINRQSGCSRGDSCRFRHDERQRENRQRELHESSSGRNENWRQSNSR